MSATVDFERRSFLLGRLAETPRPAGPPVAAIGPACFAVLGIACMSCHDACPTGAVRFELALGGAHPCIAADRCTGCGDCFRTCPADAIQLAVLEAVS